MSRILGIDYGLKRIGIAITDPECIIASPLITVNPEEFLPFVHNYCKDHNVKKIILGFPADIDKSKDIVIAIKKIYKILCEEFPNIDVLMHNESYTSKIASYSLYQFKKKYRIQKGNLDKMSASILLQSYLNSL